MGRDPVDRLLPRGFTGFEVEGDEERLAPRDRRIGRVQLELDHVDPRRRQRRADAFEREVQVAMEAAVRLHREIEARDRLGAEGAREREERDAELRVVDDLEPIAGEATQARDRIEADPRPGDERAGRPIEAGIRGEAGESAVTEGAAEDADRRKFAGRGLERAGLDAFRRHEQADVAGVVLRGSGRRHGERREKRRRRAADGGWSDEVHGQGISGAAASRSNTALWLGSNRFRSASR